MNYWLNLKVNTASEHHLSIRLLLCTDGGTLLAALSQLFAELAESVIGPEDTASRARLLLRGDPPDLQEGEALLKGAITDGKFCLH